MRLRLAILGESPCDACWARCCKQNGHEYAVLLQEHERRRFYAYSQDVVIEHDGGTRVERVIPYVGGRCPFLGEDDRCLVYEDRPGSCRAFQCTPGYNAGGVGRHSEFLRRNGDVLQLLETMR